MRVTTTKSKNAESFYITKSFINNEGKSTSRIVRKLGTLRELTEKLGTNREGVMAWAKEQARLETERYKSEREEKSVVITFQANEMIEKDKGNYYEGGYLFMQQIYYEMHMDKVCRKIREKYKFQYDINAILSDLIYTRILNPASKSSSYQEAKRYLEAPSYELHDVYHSLSVLAKESEMIQAEAYKNSGYVSKRNSEVLYYDCTNYYFEIEEEDELRKYGKSKEHRPNPIVQMGMFTDGNGIPLAFSIFPGNKNEQTSLKPLEQKVLRDFECTRFVYCSDSGLGSEGNRLFNHTAERSYIVTQSIRKLTQEEREWALERKGFRDINGERAVDLSALGEKEAEGLFYKEAPYSTKHLHQRLIVTYSPKYAAYQKQIRDRQVERAQRMITQRKCRKTKHNPNDPARFIGKDAITEEGKKASIQYYLDEARIAEEARYDGLYAVCTDLLEDDAKDIVKVGEGRWRIEECFRIMKTEFSARPVYVRREESIQAHFLICFLALLVFRLFESRLGNRFTCDAILKKLREYNFADVQQQGYIPLYTRDVLTDALHDVSLFRTDYQFLSKRKMREIQKISKGRE